MSQLTRKLRKQNESQFCFFSLSFQTSKSRGSDFLKGGGGGGAEKIELSPRTQYESTGCDLTSNARQNYNVALLASKRERKSLQLKAWTLRPGRAQTKSY